MARSFIKTKATMKAQVTVFIIVGIILVLGIGMMIYLVSSKAKQKGEEAVAIQKLRQTAIKSVNDYIMSCLDIAASQALELAGKQGGRLYISQGSLIQDPIAGEGQSYLVYDDLKIMYSIVPAQGSIGDLFFSAIPEYPWPRFPYVGTDTQFEGYFGISNLPPLYKAISGPMSIQEQLEKYVESNTAACTDWESFEAQGLNIQAGTPDAQMIIAENLTQLAYEEYISFTLNWPVTIKEYATQAESTLNEFAVSYPIRFGRIYYVIEELVRNEITNISFEPETNPDYSITIIKDIIGKDDVIVYKDMKAKLKGMPYEFRLARKNRPPALHWVNQTKIDEHGYCAGNDIVFSGNQFSFNPDCAKLMTTGDVVSAPSLSFTAYDPDNDVITFSIDPASIDDDDWIYAETVSYEINQTTGGLIIHVKANDGEFEDTQRLRFIPVAPPPVS